MKRYDPSFDLVPGHVWLLAAIILAIVLVATGIAMTLYTWRDERRAKQHLRNL